jgi:GNAT superfamily N-acetyltransferase
MEIRRIEESELHELLSLYQYLHESDDPLPEPAVVRAVWDEIQSDANQRYFGGYVDGRLVSSCVLSIIPNLTRGCRPYGVVENVVTHADYRRQGLGKAVLKAALSFAWGRNCYKAMLFTGRKSEAVFRFYESAGFDRHAKQAFLATPPGSGGTGVPERPRENGGE